MQVILQIAAVILFVISGALALTASRSDWGIRALIVVNVLTVVYIFGIAIYYSMSK